MTQRRAEPASPFREDFDAFYRREFPAMVALAAAVSGNRAVAEELAQEAMLRAHRRWSQVSQYDRPGAWVRRVTINLATSAVRTRLAEARRMLRFGAHPDTLPGPEPEDETVWQAVRALPDKQRAAIALHYLEDRPVAEIAAVLECSEATAKVHLHRGRTALAGSLAAQGGLS